MINFQNLNASELLQFQEGLKTKILAEYEIQSDDLKQPVFDGIVDCKKYLDAKFKVLWVLKEAYWGAPGEKQGGDLVSAFKEYNDVDTYLQHQKGGHKTWDKVIHVSYAIANGFFKLGQAPFKRPNETSFTHFHEMSFINIKKTPGRTTSNIMEIARYYQKYKEEVLFRQIEAFNPDIIIFGANFWFFTHDFNLEPMERMPGSSCRYKEIDRKLFIAAYHPSYWRISPSKYVDDIIMVIENWAQKRSDLPFATPTNPIT